ncbi:Arogenate dehydratase/prephenate dehydratase 1 [Hibiscus syriacus]|uniref:Arogenate dehydratase/prephenate dehydratase 1 n=1 Tax=Hibiscus syriacus TaxID=106335 RepID=A0A6A2Z348_HIBSY|nr:Arogenate dehydratase/prephenate dehydratase 1 [Hibiscus syriacus]
MALRFAPFVICTQKPLLEVSGLGSGRGRIVLGLRSSKLKCLALGAEDDKPWAKKTLTEKINEDGSTVSRAFHKDLSLLPKPLSITDLSPFPANGSNVRIAYQGNPGAYCEDAALKAYPNCESVPCDQFKSAFNIRMAVELRLVDKAILPIENSGSGSIHRTYDLLRHRLHIVREVQLVFNHCLLALPGVTMQEVKRVFSQTQALAQCEMALTNLGIIRVNDDDSAGAARMVASSGKRDIGAIASARAAALYGLDILADKIQDEDDNVTRPKRRSWHAIKALAVFSLRDINLTKMESRPQKGRPLRVVDDANRGSAMYFDYLFYLDFEASMAEPRAQNALEHLQSDLKMNCVLFGRDMPDFSESSVPIRWIWFCRWISPKLSRICHHIPQFSVKPATMVTVQPTGYACTCKSCLNPAEDGWKVGRKSLSLEGRLISSKAYST